MALGEEFQYEEEKVWHDEECSETLWGGCLFGLLTWIFDKLKVLSKR